MKTRPQNQLCKLAFLESPKQYGSTAEQLSAIARGIDPVPGDGNCLFESIARQLPGASLTHYDLRMIACETGRLNPYIYQPFTQFSLKSFHQNLDQLAEIGVWNVDIGDLAITMLRDALDLRIVVLRNGSVPHYFPDDNRAIDDNTIVVVQDDLQVHYDATLPVYSPQGKDMCCYCTRVIALEASYVTIIYQGIIFKVRISNNYYYQCTRVSPNEKHNI